MQSYYPTTIREEELKNRVAPSGFVVRDITKKVNGILGEAGNFSAEIAYYPLPTTVSFVSLEFVEVGTSGVGPLEMCNF